MVVRAGGAGTEGILAQKVTLDQTERGPRSEADHELFLERTSRASVMLKYDGKCYSLLPKNLKHYRKIKCFQALS